ncbi:MAG: hypothetical protein QM680_10635 [Luteolibacter sp.]
MAPHEYEALSREERSRRIGALLYKAVMISLARQQGIIGEADGGVPFQSGENTLQKTDEPGTASLPEEDLGLLQRYARLGEIAPRDATEFWGVSRTTAYRRLLGLEQGGWLEKRGAAKATRYTFTGQTRTLLERLKQSKPARDDSRASM